MQEFLATLLAQSLPALGALVCAAATWALLAGAAWLRARAATDEARELIDRCSVWARAAVIAVERVVVPILQRDAQSGRLTKESASEALAAALEALRAQLGPAGEASLARLLGVASATGPERQAAVERALIGMIEAALSEAKGCC
jgi:hypothetical protein